MGNDRAPLDCGAAGRASETAAERPMALSGRSSWQGGELCAVPARHAARDRDRYPSQRGQPRPPAVRGRRNHTQPTAAEYSGLLAQRRAEGAVGRSWPVEDLDTSAPRACCCLLPTQGAGRRRSGHRPPIHAAGQRTLAHRDLLANPRPLWHHCRRRLDVATRCARDHHRLTAHHDRQQEPRGGHQRSVPRRRGLHRHGHRSQVPTARRAPDALLSTAQVRWRAPCAESTQNSAFASRRRAARTRGSSTPTTSKSESR